MPASAVQGMHDQLGRRALDRVGGVDVGVPDERVAVADEQVDGRSVAAVPQVEHDVLGQRVRPVGVAGGLHQRRAPRP